MTCLKNSYYMKLVDLCQVSTKIAIQKKSKIIVVMFCFFALKNFFLEMALNGADCLVLKVSFGVLDSLL